MLQIVLTIVAWSKGWKAQALLPLAGDLLFALFVLSIAGSSPSSPDVTGVVFLGDLVCLGVLIAMVRHPRSEQQPRQEVGAGSHSAVQAQAGAPR